VRPSGLGPAPAFLALEGSLVLGTHGHVRVPGNLPKMTIRIGEVPRKSAPIRVPRRLHKAGSGIQRLCQYPIDLGLGPDVVRQGHSAKAIPFCQHPSIGRQVIPPIEPKPTALQRKEGHISSHRQAR